MGSIVCLICSGTHTYEVIPGPHGDILVLGKKAGKQIIASGWHNITLLLWGDHERMGLQNGADMVI